MRHALLTAALVAAFFLIPVAPPALLAGLFVPVGAPPLLASWPFMGGEVAGSPLAGDPSVPAGLSGPGRPSASSPLAGHADTLSLARRHLGTNPTGRRSLWCADFMNLVERKAGRAGTGSRMARSFLGYGRPVRLAEARAGDIVVLGRGRRGGHVGYLVSRSGGTVRLISGNACRPRRVCESAYPASRILGIRRP